MDMADQVKDSREPYFLKLTEKRWLNSAILIKWQITEDNLEEPGGHPSWTGWQGDGEKNLDGV